MRDWVVRPAGGVSQGEIAEQKAQDPAILDDIARAAQNDCGDAIRFQMPRGKREALVTNGTVGDEKRARSVSLTARQKLPRVHLARLLLAAVGREA